MSNHYRGRHRTPSRMSTTFNSTARVSAAVAVTGGLVATVTAPTATATEAVASVRAAMPQTPNAPEAAVAQMLQSPAGDYAKGAVKAGNIRLPRTLDAKSLVVQAPAPAVDENDDEQTQDAQPVRQTRRATPVRAERADRSERSDAPRRSERAQRTQRAATPERASRDSDRRETTREDSTPRTSASHAAVLAIARQYSGIRYVMGGGSPAEGFDCSGFTSYVYGKLGISLPHSSSAQRGMARYTSNPQPGDLYFTPGHVGIYLGNGMGIDAQNPSVLSGVHKIWGNPTFGTVL